MEKLLIAIMALYYFGIVFLMYYMFTQRKKAVQTGEVRVSLFKSYQGETPQNLQVIQNHVNNQFQIPLVFFVACLINLQQESVTSITLVLAVFFVISRLVHAYIHLGSNHVIKRAISYQIGAVTVGLMMLLPLFQ
jgi:hypothetical protein